MYLIIDTETTGLFDFSKPADHPDQPHLAALGMITTTDDLEILAAAEWLVEPDGWSMPPEATTINGLTDHRLQIEGVPVSNVLEAYTEHIDDGCIVLAYGAQYDTKIMRGALRRAGQDDRFEQTPNLCLMRACTPICKIPRANGRGYKFPKLVEACACFGITLDNPHGALADATAAYEIARKLHDLGALGEAKVHYAKNRPVATS